MPGEIPTKFGEIKILTSLCIMTGFATLTFLTDLTSKTVAVAAFNNFFAVHGLPKLIVIDAGSENAGALKAMCEILTIPYHAVAKENHKAILCE
jgi:hypothetical protein